MSKKRLAILQMAAALMVCQNAFDDPFKGGTRESDIDFTPKERPLDKGEYKWFFDKHGNAFRDCMPSGIETHFYCRARKLKNAQKKYDSFISKK